MYLSVHLNETELPFGRGINMVQDVLTGNGNTPAQFVQDDITTFKVVVHNAEYVAKPKDFKDNVSGNAVVMSEEAEKLKKLSPMPVETPLSI